MYFGVFGGIFGFFSGFMLCCCVFLGDLVILGVWVRLGFAVGFWFLVCSDLGLVVSFPAFL